MKNSSAYGKKFTAQLKKLKRRASIVEMTDPVDVLAYSQLLWESTTSEANSSWETLQSAMIDWHEVRVSTPEEIAEMCGDKSAMAHERAARLKSMMHRLYLRHHEVTMAPELELGKRDVRAAINSLDGVTPYVSARWLLLCADVGEVPVDSQLAWLLVDSGCVDEGATLEEVASWMGRQVKSDKATDAHQALQAWVDGQSVAVQKKRAAKEQSDTQAAKRARTASAKKRAQARADKAKRIAERAAKKLAEEAAKAAASKPTAAKKKVTEKAPAKKAAKKAAKKKATPKAAKKTTKKVTKKATKKTTKKVAKKAAKKTAKKTTKKSAKKKTTKKAVKKKTSRTSTKKKTAKKTKKKAAKKKSKVRKKSPR